MRGKEETATPHALPPLLKHPAVGSANPPSECGRVLPRESKRASRPAAAPLRFPFVAKAAAKSRLPLPAASWHVGWIGQLVGIGAWGRRRP
jgi:hypothetical protein